MAEVLPQRGMLRVLRGAVLASVSALLAVAAHVAGGGQPPSTSLALILTATMTLAAAALADRPRGPVAVLLAVTTVQLVMHLMLGALDGHHHGMALSQAGTAPGAMVCWHGLAVVFTAAILSRAETTLFALAGALRRFTCRLLLAPAPHRAAVLLRAPEVSAGLRRVLFATRLRLRGPPVVS